MIQLEIRDGQHEETLTLAERHVQEGVVRVARLAALADRLEESGDAELARRVREVLVTHREVPARFRERLSRQRLQAGRKAAERPGALR